MKRGFQAAVANRIGNCQQWITGGDYNIIPDQEEAQPGHRLRAITKTTVTIQNHKYQQFLNQMSATDLCRLQPECTYTTDYRCQRDTGNNNANTPLSLSIIDRILLGPDIPGAHIKTLDYKTDRTDDQPIYSRIPLPLDQHRSKTWTHSGNS